MNKGPLSHRYLNGQGDREGWLTLARRNSALTVPGLIPDTDEPRGSGAESRPVPHNNIGAQGVNTLAAKMVLQLLPPSQPFFRLEIKPEARKEVDRAAAAGDDQAQGTAQKIHGELDENLVDLETRLVREVGRENIRSTAHEAFKHLLVAGNVVLHVPEEGSASVIDLRNFVVKRDPSGTLLHLVIHERVSPLSLDEGIVESLGLEVPDPLEDLGCAELVDVYTGMVRISKKKFKVWQEIDGKVVPNSEAEYDQDRAPYIVLRGTEAANEHYGDAYVSSYEGDLIVLEGLSKAIKEAAIASSMLIFGVDPSATPNLEQEIMRANNGAALRFREGEVFVLQVNKLADFSMAAQTAQAAEMRLRQAFLLTHTRNAERVTAEEIRQNFAELQQALGGTFAILADNFQRPMLNRMMVRLKKRGGLAGLEGALKEVEPILITGVDAIGRNSELNNLLAFGQALEALVGPEAKQRAMSLSEAATRVANATSIKPAGLIKTDEQIQQETQQAQMGALGQAAAPQAVKGLMDARNSNAGGNE